MSEFGKGRGDQQAKFLRRQGAECSLKPGTESEGADDPVFNLRASIKLQETNKDRQGLVGLRRRETKSLIQKVEKPFDKKGCRGLLDILNFLGGKGSKPGEKER